MWKESLDLSFLNLLPGRDPTSLCQLSEPLLDRIVQNFTLVDKLCVFSLVAAWGSEPACVCSVHRAQCLQGSDVYIQMLLKTYFQIIFFLLQVNIKVSSHVRADLHSLRKHWCDSAAAGSEEGEPVEEKRKFLHIFPPDFLTWRNQIKRFL